MNWKSVLMVGIISIGVTAAIPTKATADNFTAQQLQVVPTPILLEETIIPSPIAVEPLNIDQTVQTYVKDALHLVGLGVDEYFIYGLMYVESRFKHSATSGAGARGIMQMMPSTWNEFYGGFTKQFPNVQLADDIDDIKSNIYIGIYELYYIKTSLNLDISSDIDRVLTSYNRGIAGANRYYRNSGTYSSGYSKKVQRAAAYIRENNQWEEGI